MLVLLWEASPAVDDIGRTPSDPLDCISRPCPLPSAAVCAVLQTGAADYLSSHAQAWQEQMLDVAWYDFQMHFWGNSANNNKGVLSCLN